MERNKNRFLGLAGVAGPVLFICTTIIAASLSSDYNHISHFISELGATGTHTEQLMNFAGFVPSGILIALFGIALLLHLTKKPIHIIGSTLLIVFGTGMAIAGLFSCDQGCPPDGSLESIIHDRVSAITFMSAITGILLLGFSFNRTSAFEKFRRYSVITGILSLALLLIMISSFESRNLTGLWQRLLLLSLFLWTSRIGLHIFKNTK
ncbi:DUF998 domain-containing protein [Kriegella aquimaris]|uniref:Hypothetical membrane protein n=1 Tax=Kriegella aquimaris TaxID=192904 RepID=A0A1G9K1Q4_9FLAO|nr:DUF998 domain-containing protein [Kriegella aquimaris]SDL43396.1 hypothetical membrane protein [Kriegella aquimaris]